jgi:hypothetical protein
MLQRLFARLQNGLSQQLPSSQAFAMPLCKQQKHSVDLNLLLRGGNAAVSFFKSFILIYPVAINIYPVPFELIASSHCFQRRVVILSASCLISKA